jgi:hypothetical protein
MRESARSLKNESTGQEIAEAALILPLFFLILAAIFQFGMVLNAKATLDYAANQGAILASEPSCATCACPNCSSTGTQVATKVLSIMAAASLHSIDLVAYTPPGLVACPGQAVACSSDQSITLCNGVELETTLASGAPACGSVVSFRYSYPVFFSLIPPITLTVVSNGV